MAAMCFAESFLRIGLRLGKSKTFTEKRFIKENLRNMFSKIFVLSSKHFILTVYFKMNIEIVTTR
jgi:hypothetical protein